MDRVRVIDSAPDKPQLVSRKTAVRRVQQGRAEWTDATRIAIRYVTKYKSSERFKPFILNVAHFHEKGIYDPSFFRNFAGFLKDQRTSCAISVQ